MLDTVLGGTYVGNLRRPWATFLGLCFGWTNNIVLWSWFSRMQTREKSFKGAEMSLLIWTFLTATMSFAKEDWVCVQEASQVVSSTYVLACGVGEGRDEGLARINAFKSAQAEFDLVCGASTGCRGRAVSVEPKRTTCEQSPEGWKCYRMLSFTIGNEQAVVVRARIEKKAKDYTVDNFWQDWNNKYLKP